MTEKSANAGGSLTRIWRRVRRSLVGPVPESSGRCEFDCRELECSHERWENCENRKFNDVLLKGGGRTKADSGSSTPKPTSKRDVEEIKL